ncbi:MAG: helix-turn-helix domain-containing protein [Desulfatibacillum sp.]|nr:helix-turn-helix domain-containing protein [Desulfatibacillum sp.]
MGEPKLKDQIPQDWHPWDIKAALGKAGYSLADIARAEGLAARTANDVLRKAYPRIEEAIANILSTAPFEIWPSRYDEEGKPRRGLHAVKTSNVL